MSRRKFAVPTTYIVGSSPKLDRKGKREVGVETPLLKADGRPVGSSMILATQLFTKGRQVGTVSHWANAGARRRCGGNMAVAKKSELVQVPVYRGIPARIANQLRAQYRKSKRETLFARAKEVLSLHREARAS